MCATPIRLPPHPGKDFYASYSYGTDSIQAKVLFYSIGCGADSGLLAGYLEDIKTIISHHAIAYVMGDDEWNIKSGVTMLGGDGHIGYELVMSLVDLNDTLKMGHRSTLSQSLTHYILPSVNPYPLKVYVALLRSLRGNERKDGKEKGAS